MIKKAFATLRNAYFISMMMTFLKCWKWRSSGSGNEICRVIGPSISQIGGVKKNMGKRIGHCQGNAR